ncbi:O-antigen ligase family protein [uncultured Polaribacter sp.]|uniref:O-antigen ligase family protein n=1 Tax=uncultured Polaribacter sp. TaxID=174711 RepID=UPI00345AB279
MVFFIFLFSSRMIILLLLLTIFSNIVYLISKKGLKRGVLFLLPTVILLAILIYPAKKGIGERFKEIKTEINKPIVGDYYNSSNTRIAILKCSLTLLKETPLFGYGDKLQEKLNDCYKQNNDSNFYLKQTFNTHNYYINLVTYGGWFFLLLFIIYLFYTFIKIKHSVLGLFLLFQILAINLTENYFSRHYGIVIYVYLIAMFIFIKERKEV